ncbi:MAG: hypothetical protein HY706_12380 [Candidatus Hydrogenedentes bacterium]|nr:hypothetical protein [Candidatus Hydrogenedentota bacterium]
MAWNASGGFAWVALSAGMLLLCTGAQPQEASMDGALTWSVGAGGGSYDYGNAIAALPNRGVAVAGKFYGGAIFGEGEPGATPLFEIGFGDVYVACYEPNGALVWAKRAGASGEDHAKSITALPDGAVAITGYFYGTATFGLGEAGEETLSAAGGTSDADLFVAKYNSDGTLAWARRAGGSYFLDSGSDITGFPDGSVALTGTFYGNATFGSGEAVEVTLAAAGDYNDSDVFVAKYGPDGTLMWAKRAGSSNFESSLDYGSSIAALDGGSMIVTGGFQGTATFGPGEAGSSTLTATGDSHDSDVFVAKYNSDGTLAWVTRAGGPSVDHGSSVAALPDGGAAVTGWFYDKATFGPGEADEVVLTAAGGAEDWDVFVAKYHPNGTLAWAGRAGSSSSDYGCGIAALPEGSVVVTGYFSGEASFGLATDTPVTLLAAGGFDDWDIFVAEYHPDGALVWAKRAGGNDTDIGNDIVALPDGSVAVTGNFSDVATFGPGEPGQSALSSTGGYDTFVARFQRIEERQRIQSVSHPDLRFWYFDPVFDINWSLYYPGVPVRLTAINQDVNTAITPTTAQNSWPAATTSSSFPGFTPGAWYFHIAAANTDSQVVPGSQRRFTFNVADDRPEVTSSSHPSGSELASSVSRDFLADVRFGTGHAGFYVGSDSFPAFYYRLDTQSDTVPTRSDTHVTTLPLAVLQVPPGTHWFHVIAEDRVGNLSQAGHYQFTVLSSPGPDVLSSSHPFEDQRSPIKNVTFSWTDPTGTPAGQVARYYYRFDTLANYEPSRADASTELRNVSFPGTSPGTYYFHIRNEDKYGLLSAVTHRAATVTIAASPQVHSTTHPDPAQAFAAKDIALQWDDPDGLAVIYYGAFDQLPNTVPDASSPSATDPTIAIPNVTSGTHYFHVRNADVYGFLSSPAHFRINVRDARAPTVTSATHPDPLQNYPGREVQFYWTDPDGLARKYYLEFDDEPGTIPTTASLSTAENDWTYSDVAQGPHFFHILSEDQYGNLSPPAHLRVNVAQGAPLIVIGDPSPTVTKTGPVNFVITYVNATSINLRPEDVTLNREGTADGVAHVAGDGNQTRIVSITDIVGDGKLSIAIGPNTATFASGAPAPPEGPSQTFIVDRTRPRLASAAAVDSVTVRLLFTEDMTQNPVLTAPASYAFSPPTSLTVSGVTRFDWRTVDVTVSEMTSGVVYTVEAALFDGPTDFVGNVMDSKHDTASFVGRGVPPNMPVITTNSGNDFETDVPMAALAGTCDPDSASLLVNGSTDGVTYTPGTSAWSYTGPLIEGQNSFAVTARDAANNFSAPDAIGVRYMPAIPETRISLRVRAPVVALGAPVEVFGRLDTYPQLPTGEAYSGKSIRLRFTLSGEVVEERLVALDSNGYLVDEWTPPSAGQWSVHAKFDGDAALQESPWCQPVPVVVQSAAGYGILITGQVASRSGLQDHQHTLNHVYRNLRFTGFDDQHIVHIDPDYSGKTPGGWHVPLSKAAIREWIEVRASDAMRNAPAPLFLVLVNHGSERIFHIFHSENDQANVITPQELDSWLDAYALNLGSDTAGEAAKKQPLVVVMGYCYSGAFIAELSQSEGELPRRVLIASADPAEEAYKGPLEGYDAQQNAIRDGDYFVSRLFDGLGRGRNLKVAFDTAAQALRDYTANANGNGLRSTTEYPDTGAQHALLDDNGNGRGSHYLVPNSLAGEEGYTAASLRLGVGNSAEPGVVPVEIIEAAPSLTLAPGGSDAPALWARLNEPAISAIWIEVKPAGFALNQSEQTEQKTLGDLPQIEPDATDSVEHRYSWSSARLAALDWTVPGMYEAMYFVLDAEGELAPIARTLVYRALPGPNQPPADFGLSRPEDNDFVNRTPALVWGRTSDPDGHSLTFTLELIPVAWPNQGTEASPFPNILIDGLTASYYLFLEPGVSGGPADLVDGVTYEWRVIAYDAYGATTSSRDTRRITVDELSDPRTDAEMWITLHDRGTGRPVDNATVNLGGMAMENLGGGVYHLSDAQRGRTFSVSVTTAAGYAVPVTFSVTVPERGDVWMTVEMDAMYYNLPSDVDENTAVNAVDVQLVINSALGLDTIFNCDIDDNGEVDAVDIQFAINGALGVT